jgi:hypothetical protein
MDIKEPVASKSVTKTLATWLGRPLKTSISHSFGSFKREGILSSALRIQPCAPKPEREVSSVAPRPSKSEIKSDCSGSGDLLGDLFQSKSMQTKYLSLSLIGSVNEIPTNLLVINKDFLPRTQIWENMSSYTFVLSPFGIGMDCHRTWEALCLGCIPIVCAPHFNKLFEDLPVLIVSDWTEITEDLLKETLKKYSNKSFKYEKLSLEYWQNNIRSI